MWTKFVYKIVDFELPKKILVYLVRISEKYAPSYPGVYELDQFV